MKPVLDTRRISIFLAITFGIAWLTALVVYLTGGTVDSPVLFTVAGTSVSLALVLIATVYMWSPAIANILTRTITREGWKDSGLRLPLGERRWWTWALAWVLPAALTLLGALLYFLVFPQHYDPELLGFKAMVDAAIEAQGQQPIPLDIWTLLLVQLGQGVLLSPIVNSLFAFGEEFGWRAYLQDKLMPLGFRKAMLLLGAIWGVWHAPVIAMGHNYGFGYPGAPWTGILAMTWFSIAAGVIFGWLTLRGRSVWPAVIAHGAINGIAGINVLFLHPEAQPNPLLGPLPVGIIAALPWTLLAAYLFWRSDKDAADVSRETNPPPTRKPTRGTMIAAENLSKQFDTVTAVDGLDVEIPAGEVFGLLGPNGAGKTTTIRMLSALIAPSRGHAWVAGHHIGEEDALIRKDVGILTETPGMYEQLSAQRNLSFFAELYEVPRVDKQVERYLRMLGLWGRRNDPVGTFSKGMRQKLAIARALLHEPKVLFLDEPTSGLDPEASRMVREFISDLKAEGRTIILSTHNLDEADRLCDRIAVLRGRLLALDTPTNLRRELFGRSVVFHLAKAKATFAKALARLPFVHEVEAVDNKLVVKLDDPEKRNPQLVAELVGLGAQIQFVGEMRQSLEDVYLQLVEAGGTA
ncbi:MAG: ATP-binding cassette domain-containing protein [Anaerolineales bacterium]|nr:ATP-binding cassette domain-containing protein [Anaerolineales bacterium]